jgi:FixJ family two-component response regulator
MPARGNNVAGAEAHRANIMHKLNLHTVGDLIRYAIGNKIVEG